MVRVESRKALLLLLPLLLCVGPGALCVALEGSPVERKHTHKLELASPSIIQVGEPVWMRITALDASATQPDQSEARHRPERLRLAVARGTALGSRMVELLTLRGADARDGLVAYRIVVLEQGVTGEPVFLQPDRYSLRLVNTSGTPVSDTVQLQVAAPNRKTEEAAELFRNKALILYLVSEDAAALTGGGREALSTLAADYGELMYGRIAGALLATLHFNEVTRQHGNHAEPSIYAPVEAEVAKAADALPRQHPLREKLLFMRAGLLLACEKMTESEGVLNAADQEYPGGSFRGQRASFRKGMEKWRRKHVTNKK